MGDFIGTDLLGTFALPNQQNGVLITSSASSNTVGGTSASARDVISGNHGDGIHIVGAETIDNLVEGDYIGIIGGSPPAGGRAATVPSALGNGSSGVAIYAGANHNTIGGNVSGSGNVISGNVQYGVFISDAGTTRNLIAGDLIGTDPAGSRPLPNVDGVVIKSGATGNTVGGSVAAARDVISGNSGDGVIIADVGTSGNLVEGDYIGLAANGSAGLGNLANGVSFFGSPTMNTIGGTAAGSRNVISANAESGVYISDSGTTGNLVEGDFIGTDSTGAVALGNYTGVFVSYGATGNTIGGTTTAARDVISGNGSDGVQIVGNGTSGNVVEGDYIGSDSTGAKAVPNCQRRVDRCRRQQQHNRRHHRWCMRRYLGQQLEGVHITGGETDGNVVEGDYIGLTATGASALGNAESGVGLYAGASDNIIGGTSSCARDVISGNRSNGLYITDAGTSFNRIEGDYIGTDGTGVHALAQLFQRGGDPERSDWQHDRRHDRHRPRRHLGKRLGWRAHRRWRNQRQRGRGELHRRHRQWLRRPGNAQSGAAIFAGANNNTIGGTVAGSGNVLSANEANGVYISDGGTTGNPRRRRLHRHRLHRLACPAQL